jgi:hypothetical protein
MKIAFPQNIFSAFISFNLSKNHEIVFKPSSLIIKEIINDDAEAGFIPSFDLINESKIFLSKKIGIAFDGNLSNSYLYFVPDKNEVKSIYLRGDITKNEVILSKILLKEKYDFEPEFILDSGDVNFEERNYLITGQENYKYQDAKNGISFSDHVAEFIEFPYVNFVLASKSSDTIRLLETELKSIDERIEKNIDEILNHYNFNLNLRQVYAENLNSVYFEMTENENIGLSELLRLPYYHGIIEDIIEPNFVE